EGRNKSLFLSPRPRVPASFFSASERPRVPASCFSASERPRVSFAPLLLCPSAPIPNPLFPYFLNVIL
ncbi:MAG TPA: hypothetical protein VK203_22625, partial [Nostocaceae cyanobacterium]|nr:hypothetical protein [Nostocaceae cyanobacterium]